MPSRVIEDTAEVMADRAYHVRDVVAYALSADVRFNANYEGMRLALRIAEACGEKGARGPLSVDEGDWEALCNALRTPQPIAGRTAYMLAPAHAAVALVDQVLNAKRPEP